MRMESAFSLLSSCDIKPLGLIFVFLSPKTLKLFSVRFSYTSVPGQVH